MFLPNIGLGNDEKYQYTVRWKLRLELFRKLGPESLLFQRTH